MSQQPLPVIQILGVGEVLNLELWIEDWRNCYRCLAVWSPLSQKELLRCSRNCFVFQMTTYCLLLKQIADAICQGICDTLAKSLNVLNNQPERQLKCFLVDESGSYFSNFTSRCTAKRKFCANAGSLDEAVAAFLLKNQIHVYEIFNSI